MSENSLCCEQTTRAKQDTCKSNLLGVQENTVTQKTLHIAIVSVYIPNNFVAGLNFVQIIVNTSSAQERVHMPPTRSFTCIRGPALTGTCFKDRTLAVSTSSTASSHEGFVLP